MANWTRILLVATSSVLITTSPAFSQLPGPVSFDATIGGGTGLGGGELHERGGLAADGILILRFASGHRRVLLTAVDAGFQGAPASSDDVCHLGSRGQCLDDFPTLATVGLFAGWEHPTDSGSNRAPTLSVLAGPAYVHLDRYGSTRRASTLGVQTRVDLASRRAGAVAGVLSVRGTLMPRVDGRALCALALGLGVRFR